MVKTSPSGAGDASSIPGLGAKIPHALQPKNQNIKQSNFVTNSIKTLFYFIFFNKDFKNGPHQKKKS